MQGLFEDGKFREALKTLSFFELLETFSNEERLAMAQRMIEKKVSVGEMHSLIKGKDDGFLLNVIYFHFC